MTTQGYKVTARLQLPDFEAERRYVRMETKLAHQEMEKTRSWLPFSSPGFGLLRRGDWQDYIQMLARYGDEMNKLEHDVSTGIVPVVFMVSNEREVPDSRIRVRVTVENGEVLHHKQAPERPPRIDGAPNQSNVPRLRWSLGFARRNVKVTARAVEAEFSRLNELDDAQLVGETLYLDAREEVKVHFEITSHNSPDGQEGEVELQA